MRTPLTITALGVPAFGVIATLGAVYSWFQLAPASATLASSAVAARSSCADDSAIDRSARRVSVAIWRRLTPVAAVVLLYAAFGPVDSVIDPQNNAPTAALRITLAVAVGVALLSVYGAAVLGSLATYARFAEQNITVVVSITTTSVVLAVAAIEHWPFAAIAVLWILAMATPGLPVACRRLPRWVSSRGVRGDGPAQPVGSYASSSLWIASGQQLASGFDLVIVSGVIGSVAAAEYGLSFRLFLLLLAPMLGIQPLLTRAAASVRASSERADRRHCRDLLAGALVVELALIGLAVAVHRPIFWLLSRGQISVSWPLLAAGSVWCTAEVFRRCLLALTATERGMVIWRRVNIVAAVANVALSVVLAREVGVAGPLIASGAASVAMFGFCLVLFRRPAMQVLRSHGRTDGYPASLDGQS